MCASPRFPTYYSHLNYFALCFCRKETHLEPDYQRNTSYIMSDSFIAVLRPPVC